MKISVVVPTRNRPDQVVPCVESILGGTVQDVEIWIVDQSDSDATQTALGPLLADPRVRLQRTASRGDCPGRNLGIQKSGAALLATTDDDCRPRPDWLEQILEEFADDPEVGVICGQVRVPAELLRPDSQAASFYPERRVFQRRLPPDWHWGITANLAIRRAAFERIGPFDEAMGAASPLRSGGDTDWIRRAIRRGVTILHTPGPEVIHLGVRHGADAREVLMRDDFGLGAALAKGVRLGDRAALACAGRMLARHSFGAAYRIATLQRPFGAGRLLAFLKGAGATLAFPLDRRAELFVLPKKG